MWILLAIAICMGLYWIICPNKILAWGRKSPLNTYFWVGKLDNKIAVIIVRIIGIILLCVGAYGIFQYIVYGIF